MAVPFLYHLRLAVLLTTVNVCGCTMLYLVIEQHHSINRMQKALDSICIKSIAAQTTVWVNLTPPPIAERVNYHECIFVVTTPTQLQPQTT